MVKKISEILVGYECWCRNVRELSTGTLIGYSGDIAEFIRFICELKNVPCCLSSLDDEFLKDIDVINILDYMNYLSENLHNSSSTRARRLASLRSFFNYLTVKIRILDKNPLMCIENPKLKKRLPKYLTLDESLRFLDAIKEYGGKNFQRDYAIAVFFLNCGMRLSELVGINLKDISTDGSLRIIGKGNKERIIYLNDSCMSALNNYKLVRKDSKDKNALFLSRSKTRISPKTVQYLIKKYLFLAGLGNRGFSTHKLRHTAATLMYQHGGTDILVLQKILGHENISLTKIYTHTSSKQLKSAFDTHPLSNLNSK